MTTRTCSRITCQGEAVSTFTYVYADSIAVLGPLSFQHEPHSYDLCAKHTEKLSAPQGWQIVRYTTVGTDF
ncbi:DUF3499 family protein [Subtercola frigoramans]|jgi:hypothetical protein|uniref:DUF3499 domain-containing protein n=1 Tax=Subtercola frigoramans TaxID=120298 RepID=A0ABS2L8E8_9MICO|nr:DUF3499 family protein [Subtercola frigoramans]MBM7473269.1 hypothetical protein [Subtercola frigoramans]